MKSNLLIALLLLVSGFAHAQWEPGGILLSPGAKSNYTPELAMNSINSAWEVWRGQDTTGSFPGAIYLSGYNKLGDPLAGFTGGAIAISDSGDYYMPQIAMSGDTEFIVTWYGYADSSSNFSRIYMQKYTHAGVALWNGGHPLMVSAADTTQNKFPQVASDKNGGAYVCWTRFDQNLDPSSTNVLLQRIDNNGHVASGWANTSVAIGVILNQNEWYPKLAVTPAGDAVYVQYIRGLITALSSWVVKINAADGTPASGFETGSGVIISDGPNLNPILLVENFIFCDSLGNGLAVWTEGRISGNGEIYYQKISSTGALTYGIGGIMMAGNNQNGFGYLYASLDDDGAILATWNDYVNNYDVGCIKFKTNGTIVWQHATTPLTSNGNSAYPKIIPDHLGGSYIFYDDVSVNPRNLYCLRLNASDSLLWSLPGLFIGLNYDVDGFDPQFDFQVTNVNGVQSSVTWEYTTTNLFNVYACDVLPSKQSCFDAPNGVPYFSSPLNRILISPNPSKDRFNVSVIGSTSSSSMRFKLYNEMGILVLNQPINESAVIETIGLSAGFYFGKVMNERGDCLEVKKIILQQ